MANKYHINPETGRVNICRAEKRICDFAVDGVPPKHYDSKVEAKQDSEKMLENKYKTMENPLSKKSTKNAENVTEDSFVNIDPNNLPEQLKPHKSIVFSSYTDNIFFNKQGKAAFIDYNGELTVYKKDGSIDKNSSLHKKDVNELKNAQRIGGWYQVAKPSDDNLSEEDNNEVIRMEHVRDAGYPLTTHLNPDPDQTFLKLGEKRKNRFGVIESSPILHTETTANPHEALSNNEFLGDSGWGEDTSVEVWQDLSNPKRTILVATAGDHVVRPGERGTFMGDQSRRELGTSLGWQSIGAFRCKEGGEAVGQIPNKKMPLYTYK